MALVVKERAVSAHLYMASALLRSFSLASVSARIVDCVHTKTVTSYQAKSRSFDVLFTLKWHWNECTSYETTASVPVTLHNTSPGVTSHIRVTTA